MMKRFMTLVLVLLFIFSIHTTGVIANSGPPVRGITILPDVCDETEVISVFPGNIDILVRTEDFSATDFGAMTEQYKEFYPFYDSIDYLDTIPIGWISFSAYYQDESKWGYADYYCGMQFGDEDIVRQVKEIRVVYFDDDGSTLELSEVMDVPNVYFYQRQDTLIYIDTETNVITDSLEPEFNAYFILTIFAVLALMTFSIFVEFIIALLFKIKGPKPILHVLLVNLFTQTAMYLYFFIYFDTYHGDYRLQLYLFEVLIVVMEFGYLYVLLKKLFAWQRLALFVLVANIISYLLGFIMFL